MARTMARRIGAATIASANATRTRPARRDGALGHIGSVSHALPYRTSAVRVHARAVLRCYRPMSSRLLDLTLEVAPQKRFDVVEMRSRFADEHAALAAYPHCLYWSSHTTAGSRSQHLHAAPCPHVSTYVEAFRTPARRRRRARPTGAPTDSMLGRATEPRNADSHLAFIASGLRPCHPPNQPGEAVCFVDLDGIVEGRPAAGGHGSSASAANAGLAARGSRYRCRLTRSIPSTCAIRA